LANTGFQIVYNYIGLELTEHRPTAWSYALAIWGNGIRWNERKHVELEQFLHAFTSRRFDSVSWAFLSNLQKFCVLVEVGEWYMVCHMTQSKVKVMEVQKLQKWPMLKSISSDGMHIIKRQMVNYDIPRQFPALLH